MLGVNTAGSLGDGTETPRLEPRPVPGLTDVADVAVGPMHACALRTDGRVWCWGLNEYGQLGIESDDYYRTAPTLVAGLENVVSIALGAHHTCAVRADRSLWCWGQRALERWPPADDARRPARVSF